MFFWTFISWCALYFAIRYEEELKEKNLRLVASQALAMDAQNRMLRYQINPHFLFNTLNALSSLILARENERAERVVLSLSSFLRHTLEKELPDKAPLSDEIEAQRQYLLIEQARFEDRLNYVEDIPADLRDALAPSLILQPLVENAVKYGVARSTGPVTIQIKAEAADGRLRLTVSDDGANGGGQQAPPKLGLGLENVRRRLELIYGKAAALTCGPRRPQGFLAAVEIPLERA
jgi:LytS/YehU family sensor histidine kinase